MIKVVVGKVVSVKVVVGVLTILEDRWGNRNCRRRRRRRRSRRRRGRRRRRRRRSRRKRRKRIVSGAIRLFFRR